MLSVSVLSVLSLCLGKPTAGAKPGRLRAAWASHSLSAQDDVAFARPRLAAAATVDRRPTGCVSLNGAAVVLTQWTRQVLTTYACSCTIARFPWRLGRERRPALDPTEGPGVTVDQSCRPAAPDGRRQLSGGSAGTAGWEFNDQVGDCRGASVVSVAVLARKAYRCRESTSPWRGLGMLLQRQMTDGRLTDALLFSYDWRLRFRQKSDSHQSQPPSHLCTRLFRQRSH